MIRNNIILKTGFDGICCMSGEAINPQRNMPLAVIITLVGVTILYILAALGLSGMLPYTQISEVSGFPNAFFQRDYYWTAQICAVSLFLIKVLSAFHIASLNLLFRSILLFVH